MEMMERLDLSHSDSTRRGIVSGILAVAAALSLAGCGTTQNRTATEQLATSDAVDRSIARIDFAPLSGQKVFLDLDYLRNVKGVGAVNSEYIISSLRQQILAAGCLLQDNKHLADYVIEARVGTLGLDGHEIVYGIPANNALNAASSLMPAAPATLPAIPEIALAKRNDQTGAAKIGAFAYNRVTREVVWQAGTSQSRSTLRDSWVAGVGPFQSGTVYKEPRFSATRVSPLPLRLARRNSAEIQKYSESRVFEQGLPKDPAKAESVKTLFGSGDPKNANGSNPPGAAPIQQASTQSTGGRPDNSSAATAEIPPEAMEFRPGSPAPFPTGDIVPQKLEPKSGGSVVDAPRRGSRPVSLEELDTMFSGQPPSP